MGEFEGELSADTRTPICALALDCAVGNGTVSRQAMQPGLAYHRRFHLRAYLNFHLCVFRVPMSRESPEPWERFPWNLLVLNHALNRCESHVQVLVMKPRLQVVL